MWPGSGKVRNSLKDLSGLHYQEVPQQRRCSFILNDESLLAEIRSRVDQLGCDIISSPDNPLDVLPRGVSRASTFTRLIHLLHVTDVDILVAGDTLNDLAMYQCGFKGVIVVNAEQALIDATKHIQHIYRTEFPGAGGIIMGMEYFGFISRFAKK